MTYWRDRGADMSSHMQSCLTAILLLSLVARTRLVQRGVAAHDAALIGAVLPR